MAKDIILKNQVWEDVPAVDLPIDGGGMQRFTDVSNTTATPSDVANGKVFYDAQGIQRDGTSSGGGANLQTKTATYTPTTSQQTDTISPDTGYDGLSSVGVTVNAMPNAVIDEIDSVIDKDNQTHTATVRPYLFIDSPGYIGEGQFDGITRTVSASELVRGTKSISANGTGIDVTNYASVDVSVPSGGATLQTKSKSYTPSETAQNETIRPDSGYDGLSSVDISVGAIPSNYVGTGVTRRDDDDMSGVVDDPYYVVSAPSGYYPSSAEYFLPLMTLPSTVESTHSGTRKANFLPSTSQRYLTIPSGYNPTTQYYQLIGAELLSLNVTQNGTYDPATYDVFGFGSVTVDVQGGASNFITGDFTTGSSAGHTEISIPYTGSGYPIMAVVVVDGGAYNSAISPWYSSVQRYAVGQWTMTKSVFTSAPTYSTSGTQNQGVTTAIYKNSTSSSTSYTRTSGMSTNVFSSNNASNSAVNTIKFKSGNVLSYYVNTSSYGLLPNTKYRYWVIYSE